MGDTIATLRETVRGRVITPSDPDSEDARAVYNAMHDRRPAAVVQCVDSADVMAVVTAARDGGLDLAIRGGGHSVPGSGTLDDGLVSDLSKMNHVWVDPEKKVVRVGGGATLADVAHATYPFGLAAPGGSADDGHRAPANYGANYERLAAVTASYDPDNLFRANQNTAPARGS